MTPVNTSSHHTAARKPHLWHRITVAPPAPNARAAPPILSKPPHQPSTQQPNRHPDLRSVAGDPGQRIPCARRRPTKFP
jgi:hypothetical protein